MIDFEKPIYSRKDGTYVATVNENPYHIIEGDPLKEEVEAYLADHPEALVTEPVPEPPSQEELSIQEERALLGYLAGTDWYVARWGETGVEIPVDIKAKRQEARARISELRA